MQTTENLKRNLQTAQDLQSVVKTMKALAAVNIRQFEEAVHSLADYNRTVELGLRVLLRRNPQAVVKMREAPRRRLGSVVFGSDQGMCGPLNDQVAEHAVEEMDRLFPDRANRTVLAVGQRIAGRLEDSGQPVADIMAVPGSTSGITPRVQDLLLEIERWREEQGIDTIRIFYADHLSGASYEPRTVEVLPIDGRWLQSLGEQPWPTRQIPLLTLDWERLFSALVQEYLFVSFYRAFAESLASENASRLASMQGAERNIEDRINDLTTRYHQQRQLAITEELLDIAAGFEALTGGQGP